MIDRSPGAGKAPLPATRKEGGVVQQAVSRTQFLRRAAAAALLAVAPAEAWRAAAAAADPGDTIVVQWNAAALQGVRDSKLGPPMVARALAIVHEAIYEAWAAYDRDAVGARLGETLRRPAGEGTASNKREAVSFAAYRASVDLFPASAAATFEPLMRRLGYDSSERSQAGQLPSAIGNRAAQAVLAFRHWDGANQLGDEPGGSPGVPYSDYTGYSPANAPMDMRVPFDPTLVRNPNRWQPLLYPDATGIAKAQPFVGAQWGRVEPFALTSVAQVPASASPAPFGSPEFERQALQLVWLSAGLTDEQKMIAEYWADGPHSELPPGHWSLHAQFVSRRDRHDLDADVKLFYALTTAVADAAVCCWNAKRFYDSVRPVTGVRCLLLGRTIDAWAGPYLGTRGIPGEAWLPYQPPTFPTPPFPEYSSGHSTFSAAGAEILRLFTGHDRFGASVTFAPGSSRVEPGAVPAAEVTLRWPTFRDAADQAGISRRYGGIHFETGDLSGRAAGRAIARLAWDHAQRLFGGVK
jgi:Domain of unknown function (DUF6851)/VCPO second helical-bundle domain